MNYKYFVGIDVSKETFQSCLTDGLEIICQENVPNNLRAVRAWIERNRKRFGTTPAKTLYCLEYTGVYNQFLINCLVKKKAKFCVESGLRIKKSIGITRGKADIIDAQRIAEYAYINRNKLIQWQPYRLIIQNLMAMNSIRSRLQTTINRLQTPLLEKKPYTIQKVHKSTYNYCKKTISTAKEEFQEVSQAMIKLINSDAHLRNLFHILTSVPGVGPVLAVEVIIATKEFKAFNNPRKFACYCGVAPFEHTSGTSLTGKTKVSRLANKRLKSIIHMCAMSSVRVKGDLRKYYLRKVEEGKKKMLIVNNIRNKIIRRMFACVRDNRVYEMVRSPKEKKRITKNRLIKFQL